MKRIEKVIRKCCSPGRGGLSIGQFMKLWVVKLLFNIFEFIFSYFYLSMIGLYEYAVALSQFAFLQYLVV